MIFRLNLNQTGLSLEYTLKPVDGGGAVEGPTAMTESTDRPGEYEATITDGQFWIEIERVIGTTRGVIQTGYVSEGRFGFACFFENRFEVDMKEVQSQPKFEFRS